MLDSEPTLRRFLAGNRVEEAEAGLPVEEPQQLRWQYVDSSYWPGDRRSNGGRRASEPFGYDPELLVGYLRRAQDAELMKKSSPELYADYSVRSGNYTSESDRAITTVQTVKGPAPHTQR
jgi:hypothetical protein